MNNLALFIHKLEDNGLLTFKVIGDSDEHFNNRLKIQKYVYLAKYFGLDLGYDFDMYLHGPYSSRLTSSYYNVARNTTNLNSITGNLDNTFREREFFDYIGNKDKEWLEVASTLLELSNHYSDKECLIEKTLNAKPHIEKDKVNEIVRELEKSNLLYPRLINA
ncbi:MAG: hypothetical protein K0S93_909 [Nitrososphaeraceae archaeon]|jgi:uncharacterized protein YwgA|nr:hypothetical protein [Nitrososphaeraceae archaeon]